MTIAKATQQPSDGQRPVLPCLPILLFGTVVLLVSCVKQPASKTPEITDGQVDIILTQSASHVSVEVRADMLIWVDFHLDDALSPFHTAVASPFSASLDTGGLKAGVHRIRVIAAVFLLIAMWSSGQSPAGYSSATYLWIVLLALVPQLIGHSTFNWALRYLPATLVAVISLGEPVGSAVLAYLFLEETPGILTLLGGVIILAGIFIASHGGREG